MSAVAWSIVLASLFISIAVTGWVRRQALRRQWLDVPIVEEARDGRRRLLPNRQGVQQGGVISPLLANMRTLDGFNVLEPKSSGAILLESSDRESWPILVVGSYGKGRTLVLATDYSWIWYSGMVA